MRIVEGNFLVSSVSIEDSPTPNIAEIAFLGRSNVGKSSLLNSLSKRKSLAKSSSTPGKTQLINYFDIRFKSKNPNVDDRFARFVDLPGFGYAKVSKSIKKDWHKNLTQYLEKRLAIQVFIHLIDSRHHNLEIDKSVDEFLNFIQRDDQIILQVFTKIDKLKQSDLSKLKKLYPEGIFISNLKNRGIDILEKKIIEYIFGDVDV